MLGDDTKEKFLPFLFHIGKLPFVQHVPKGFESDINPVFSIYFYLLMTMYTTTFIP